MDVDWTKPIEAVHEDGRVVPVALGGEGENPDNAGDYYTLPSLGCGTRPGIWRPDGSTWANVDPGWRIRNVQSAAEPSVGTTYYNTKPPYQKWERINRDGEETWTPATGKPSEIDAALVERMVAALRLAADMGSMSHADDIDAAGEAARAIVADLPEPVDADRDAAKSALEECGFAPGHVEDNSLSLQIALAAIKRGRALEREGK